MMVLAVTLHNIPEGMAVGVVYAGYLAGDGQITMMGALALSLGIAIQNFPEGAIISMPLRAEGMSKPRAFAGGVLSGAVEPLGALLTILAAGLVVPALPYLLSFAAGAMIYVVVEELIPEMSQGKHSDIGAEKAKSIALKHAGLAASDTAFIYANLDYENGLRVYDVEFFSGNKEYDYKINAATGDIVSFDQDIEWYAAGGYQAQANTDIGAEKAKSIALEHAGVAAADTVFINVELDYDDGMRVYDVEFFSGNKEYDYKIDAASGAILGFDFDVEWYTVSSKASDYIGEAKAKQIVEQAAGTTGVYTEFKLEVDDGRVLYEGEMRSGWMEYEFEIDAVTGAILDWDADWD